MKSPSLPSLHLSNFISLASKYPLSPRNFPSKIVLPAFQVFLPASRHPLSSNLSLPHGISPEFALQKSLLLPTLLPCPLSFGFPSSIPFKFLGLLPTTGFPYKFSYSPAHIPPAIPPNLLDVHPNSLGGLYKFHYLVLLCLPPISLGLPSKFSSILSLQRTWLPSKKVW